MLCYISKILKIESNSQLFFEPPILPTSCVISQRYSKLKAIHNMNLGCSCANTVVLYLKDTQNWKQFTTPCRAIPIIVTLCYISKILKIESNSQHVLVSPSFLSCCVISQRYSKLKAIHNIVQDYLIIFFVVLYLKDTQNWKQFTTRIPKQDAGLLLCYISKILKIESNSQRLLVKDEIYRSCVISQRYSKLKAIHNISIDFIEIRKVVLYLKDTQNWKQFTTTWTMFSHRVKLCYISKILKIESNSQHLFSHFIVCECCVISQRYSKLKAIHNWNKYYHSFR